MGEFRYYLDNSSCVYNFQENFNALHLASTYSREDVIKVLLPKKGVDVYSPGGVCYLIFMIL